MNKTKVLVVGNQGRLNDFLCKELASDFDVDFLVYSDELSDSYIRGYDSILYSGGEVRNPEKFITENFHIPYSLFLKASKFNIRFVFLSSLASLYYTDVIKFDSMKSTDYCKYAESKYMCDQAIASHGWSNACSLKLASINHPVRISSSYQKYLSSSTVAKVTIRTLGTYISYCTYSDILKAALKALTDASQRSIIVSTPVIFWGRLSFFFRPLLCLNIKKIPRRYYTRLYFATLPSLFENK
jgi:hypothetical protein